MEQFYVYVASNECRQWKKSCAVCNRKYDFPARNSDEIAMIWNPNLVEFLHSNGHKVCCYGCEKCYLYSSPFRRWRWNKITSLGVVTLRIFHFFSEYRGNQYPQKFDEINSAFHTPTQTGAEKKSSQIFIWHAITLLRVSHRIVESERDERMHVRN